MDPPRNGAEDTNQGNGMEEAPKTEPTDQTPQPTPRTGKKQQDQRTGPSAWKKKKAQNTPAIYTLTDDDMDKIGYQLRDAMEEVLEEATKKQEELQTQVQDQFLKLQQLLEIVRLAPAQGSTQSKKA
jgi:hypothetical protein